MGNEQYYVPMYTRFSTCHQSTAVCVLYTDAEERYVRFIFEVDVIVIVLVPEKTTPKWSWKNRIPSR